MTAESEYTDSVFVSQAVLGRVLYLDLLRAVLTRDKIYNPVGATSQTDDDPWVNNFILVYSSIRHLVELMSPTPFPSGFADL